MYWFSVSDKRQCSNGMIIAFQAVGPGSIPGWRMSFVSKFYRQSFTMIIELINNKDKSESYVFETSTCVTVDFLLKYMNTVKQNNCKCIFYYNAQVIRETPVLSNEELNKIYFTEEHTTQEMLTSFSDCIIDIQTTSSFLGILLYNKMLKILDKHGVEVQSIDNVESIYSFHDHLFYCIHNTIYKYGDQSFYAPSKDYVADFCICQNINTSYVIVSLSQDSLTIFTTNPNTETEIYKLNAPDGLYFDGKECVYIIENSIQVVKYNIITKQMVKLKFPHEIIYLYIVSDNIIFASTLKPFYYTIQNFEIINKVAWNNEDFRGIIAITSMWWRTQMCLYKIIDNYVYKFYTFEDQINASCSYKNMMLVASGNKLYRINDI